MKAFIKIVLSFYFIGLSSCAAPRLLPQECFELKGKADRNYVKKTQDYHNFDAAMERMRKRDEKLRKEKN